MLAIGLVVVASALLAGGAAAKKCGNGADVKNEKHCELFAEYVERGTRPVDSRIADRFPKADSLAPPIRSFAFVVSVSEYPNLPDAADRVLPAVKADLPKIVEFLREQQFDEIIVLKDQDATPDAIESVFDDYLIPQMVIHKGRSRFVFAYNGHGSKSADPALAGGLALSGITSENDMDFSHFMPLADLRNKLEHVATFAYQSVALLGSCFSGGVFPPYSVQGDNFTYSKKPGAHVVTAARADELAWTLEDNSGTVFFQKFLSTVRRIRPLDAEPSATILSTPSNAFTASHYIVRLGRVVVEVNERLESLPNPRNTEGFPQLQIGAMAPKKNYEGAFFFLGQLPPAPAVASVAINKSAPIDDAAKTLNDLIGNKLKQVEAGGQVDPDIAVFKVPEAYDIRGVDLVAFQGMIDFEKLRQEDIRFAYVKATQSSNSRDRAFARNWEEARKAKVDIGAYHFFNPCKSAEDQFGLIKEVVPRADDALPFAVDAEMPPEQLGRQCYDTPEGWNRLHELLGKLKAHYGKTPMIYAAARDVSKLDARFAEFSLWIASYTKGGRLSGVGGNPWTLWQVTDRARFDGVSGPVDLNVFFGTDADYRDFVAGKGNVARCVASQAR